MTKFTLTSFTTVVRRSTTITVFTTATTFWTFTITFTTLTIYRSRSRYFSGGGGLFSSGLFSGGLFRGGLFSGGSSFFSGGLFSGGSSLFNGSLFSGGGRSGLFSCGSLFGGGCGGCGGCGSSSSSSSIFVWKLNIFVIYFSVYYINKMEFVIKNIIKL